MMESLSLSFLVLLLSGGVVTGVPIGLPPAEPNPVMSRVAPDNALVYVAWNGTADASGDSPNHTERLLAEPHVKRFIELVVATLEDSVKQAAGQGENSQRVAQVVPRIVRTMLTRPTTFFIGQVGVGPVGVTAPLGLVVDLGDKAPMFEKSFKLLQQVIADEPGTTDTSRGTTWNIWPTPPGIPRIAWGISEGYFILGVGDGTVENIQARMKADKESSFLAAIHKRLPVERVANVTVSQYRRHHQDHQANSWCGRAGTRGHS